MRRLHKLILSPCLTSALLYLGLFGVSCGHTEEFSVNGAGIPKDSCYQVQPGNLSTDECRAIVGLISDFKLYLRLAALNGSYDVPEDILRENGISDELIQILRTEGREKFSDYVIERFEKGGDKFAASTLLVALAAKLTEHGNLDLAERELTHLFSLIDRGSSPAWQACYAAAIAVRAEFEASKGMADEARRDVVDALHLIGKDTDYPELRVYEVSTLGRSALALGKLGGLDVRLAELLAAATQSLKRGEEVEAGHFLRGVSFQMMKNHRDGYKEVFRLAYNYICQRNDDDACKYLSISDD